MRCPRLLGAGEAGVRRLAREMDSAASKVWGMLCEGVIQGLELALLLLGDMYGLAVSQGPQSTLGLKVRHLNLILKCRKSRYISST